MNSWLRRNVQIKGDPIAYETLNDLAKQAPIGSEKLVVLPFGNGAERVLKNKELGASFHHLDLNRHNATHMSRAVQEGIVFALGAPVSGLCHTVAALTVARIPHG